MCFRTYKRDMNDDGNKKDGAVKLTKVQREALADLDGRFRFRDETTATFDAIDWARKNGFIESPWPSTRWWLTTAGRAALKEGEK